MNKNAMNQTMNFADECELSEEMLAQCNGGYIRGCKDTSPKAYVNFAVHDVMGILSGNLIDIGVKTVKEGAALVGKLFNIKSCFDFCKKVKNLFW